MTLQSDVGIKIVKIPGNDVLDLPAMERDGIPLVA